MTWQELLPWLPKIIKGSNILYLKAQIGYIEDIFYQYVVPAGQKNEEIINNIDTLKDIYLIDRNSLL